MIKQVLIFESYFVFLIASSFLSYFTSSGVVSFGLPILSSFFVLIYFLLMQLKINRHDWLILFFYISFTSLSFFYYYLNPYKGYIISQHVIFILTFPFSYLCLVGLGKDFSKQDFLKFFNKIIIFFALGQVFVTLGQFSHYVYGVGFKVIEDYQNIMMISGTFYNSNDLAVVVVLMAFVFKYTYQYLTRIQSLLIWSIFAYLLIVTGSRVCIFLFFIILFSLGSFTYKKIFLTLVSVVSTLALIIILGNFEVDVDHPFYRIIGRINTFQAMFEYGLTSDESMSDRGEFYLYFLKNINNIGLGSGLIGDYHKYANSTFHFSPLFFTNPHSFIIEIAYWIGWLGLIIYLILYLLIVIKSNFNMLFFLISFVTLFVSSTLMGNMIYFLSVTMACWVCYLSSRKSSKVKVSVL